MKLNITLNKSSAQSLTETGIKLLKQYGVFIFVIGTLGIFGFLVFRVRTLATQEPSESAITEKAGQSRPIGIDKSAVEKIEQLQSANIEVKALFDQNRDNPFQE
jgi:hypothetical protein